MIRTTCVAIAVLLLAPGVAWAQKNPAFEYGKAEEVKDVKGVEWSASAQSGLIITTGNSRTTTITAGAKASRKQDDNRFQGEVALAYARSSILLASDDDGSMFIEADEIDRLTQTTTQSWLAKLRYDRFLTEHNSLFITAIGSADEPAGKELVAGGQAGYARQLFKNEAHEVSAEAGYDFSYERYVAGNSVSIHSARLFAGYTGKLSGDTKVETTVEGLANVNSLDAPGGEVDAFEDIRITGNAGLTTQLYEDISFRFSFGLKFDNAPGPLAAFGAAPFAADFTPLADELDTKTEAVLIINFL